MDIEKLCLVGENKTLEYKRNTDSLDSVLRSVVAFANTVGGIILIGVEDNGEIVGLDHPGKTQEQLANSIANRIRPRLIPDLIVEKINDRSVIALRIEHTSGPYYLNDRGIEKGVYVRMGNSNHLAGVEIIEELKRARNSASFDRQSCDDVRESDLDLARINTVYTKHNKLIDTEKLIGIGLLTKMGSRIVATNGAVILFGLPNVREQYFPYAEVRCARFEGNSRAEFIDRLNIEGGILSAIKEVPKFIRRNTKMAGKFGEMERRDIPEFPTEAIREALINALVHANYEISGSRIFIGIYDDRLEIQNPGVMLPGMSIEQFKAGVSRIRNPVIARTFRELGLIEEWGSGYKRIQNACEAGKYPVPKWEEFGSVLRVTFYPHPESAEQLGTKLAPGQHPVSTQLAPSSHPVDTTAELNTEMLYLIDFCNESRAFHEILSHMGWKDRTKFRRQFILPLLKLNMIKRTIPEKPSSSKQKYLITESGVAALEKINRKL